MLITPANLQLLYRGFSAAFKEGFGSAKLDGMEISMVTTSETSTTEYGWLGQFPGLKEWVGERVRRGIAQHGYSIKNKDFEGSVTVARNDIEDNALGVYGPLMMEMGRAAAAHPIELTYQALKNGHTNLCYDGQNFFDTDHPSHDGTSVSNRAGGAQPTWFLLDLSRAIRPIVIQKRRDYQFVHLTEVNDENVWKFHEFEYGIDGRCNSGYGLWQMAYASSETLSPDSYRDARAAMRAMTGDEGRPLGIEPTHLVCGTALEEAGLEILNAVRKADGATNVWAGTAKLLSTPWLNAA